MGCCISNFSADKVNMAVDGIYEEIPALPTPRFGSKRSFTSRISSGSSGVSSACTTPSRGSLISRSSTPTPKPNNFNFQNCNKKELEQNIGKVSVCDDFGEGPYQPCQMDLDQSYGYYSECLSAGSSASTPTKCFRQTKDTSIAETDTPVSDLEMEMYMMLTSQGIMPKTSSPFVQRRDVTFDKPATTVFTAPSNSYQKWSNYLQSTPAYMLHNVTNIPEAIAGQFSPADFPGFSDLGNMENAAKRYKVDETTSALAMGITHTISTDL